MPAQKKVLYGVSLLTVLLALYCYNPFALYFQSDDFIHIPLSAAGELFQQNSFRPVCDISIMTDYHLWGKTAWGYHAGNLLLHIIACSLFYHFMKLLLVCYRPVKNLNFTCSLSAVLFFIYAMHSEAVFWILGRSAILGFIGALLFLCCYLKRNGHHVFAAAFVLAWVFCLFTYESTWILPFFAVIISMTDIRKGKTTRQREIVYLAVIVTIFIMHLFLRDYLIHEVAGNYESALMADGHYLLLVKHFLLLFIRAFIPAFINNKLLLGLFAGITLLMGWLLFKRGSAKTLPVLIVCCLPVALLPYISLGVDTNGTESERFLYLPTAIVVIFFALIINTAGKKYYWLYAILYVLHLAVLFAVKDNYRAAGNFNRQFAGMLATAGNRKVVCAVGLPQSQNGAFILRQGFPQMLRWLCNKNPDTVITCSVRHELFPLKQPYSIQYTSMAKIPCGDTLINPSPDTLLINFTDSVLFIAQ